MRVHVRGRRNSPRTVPRNFGCCIAVALLTLFVAACAYAAPLNQTGRWVASPSLGFSSTHTVVLREPGTDATKVFMFGESGTNQTMRFWRFFPGDTNLITPTTASARSSLLALPHPNNLKTDLFCTGHATLPDGRMLMVGGAWIPRSPCREVYTLDPAWRPGSPTFPWIASAQMAVQRWYATATPLPDGGVLASAGTMSSGMLGFGGLARVASGDTTWRVLQPLNLATHFSWGDTTAAPGDTCTAGCPPARFNGLRWRENYTAGRFPPGRESHVFVGDYAGRAFVYGGRRRLASGAYEVLGDAWHLYASLRGDDTTHAWSLLEQVGDPSLPAGQDTPGPRWGCAATWAGVEDRSDTREQETTGALICYIQGGRNAAGAVLGDLWRGERRLVAGPHYQWAWKRILAGDATTKRYGHTMVYDPGAPGADGALRAKLVIFGGWVGPTQLVDPTKLYAVGVGPQSTRPGTWREIVPAGTPPPARAWHAMTPRWRDEHDDERLYYLFGGESGASDALARPVAPDLWTLERADVSPAQEDAFTWTRLASDGPGPSGRSRPALGYCVDGDMIVVVGGDTTGSAAPGGQTNAIWTVDGRYYNDTITWRTPLQKSFHPGPPPIAGLGLIAIGAGRARVTRSLERFSPASDSRADSECGPLFGQWRTVTTPDSLSERPLADYPNMFVLPDGRLFNAGPAHLPGSLYKRFFDLGTARWQEGLPGGQRDVVQFGTAAMFRPGRILRAGNTNATGTSFTQTIAIDAGASPPWRTYAPNGVTRPALLTRTHLNLTLLPTGDMLATGGVRTDDDVVGSAVRAPQIWSVARGRWSDPTPGSSEALAPDPWIRNYHSTAVLLPDARVLTAGGEWPSPDSEQTSASVFEPPYLFRSDGSYAQRPGVASGPGRVAYGTDFTLSLTIPARTLGIRSVALMRPSATTHGFDQGQRYVPLEFVARSSPTRLLVRAPADANLAPPGDYLLFVVDSLGTDAPAVPSVARWVRIDKQAASPFDSADVVPPRGGDALDLRDASACDDPQPSQSVRLMWNAPADDDTIAFSGPAIAYDLRYTLNADASAPFSTWTPLFTGAPQDVGSREERALNGLGTNVWYRFQLKAIGDAADTSAPSRALITKPPECSGGAGVPGPAGQAVTTNPDGRDGTDAENNVFPGVAPGNATIDMLPLPSEPPLLPGGRQVYVREGSDRGSAIDRLTLAVVDHAPGVDAVVVAGPSIITGARRAALRVTDAAGTDLTAQALGIGLEPIHADSGATLYVTLAPKEPGYEDVFVLESAWGASDRAGISVDAAGPQGSWLPLATLHPRRAWSTQAVRLQGETSLRLRLHDAIAIRFIGQLSAASYANSRGAQLLSARSSYGTDWTSEASLGDGRAAITVPGDTLFAAFTELPAWPGVERSWFLVVQGQPLLPDDARRLAGLGRLSVTGTPVAFRLYGNRPNPFANATRFEFDLPEAANVELDVYDLQGRLVHHFDSHEDAGHRAIEWDLRDGGRQRVPPGVYGYRLRAGSHQARQKLIVMP